MFFLFGECNGVFLRRNDMSVDMIAASTICTLSQPGTTVNRASFIVMDFGVLEFPFRGASC